MLWSLILWPLAVSGCSSDVSGVPSTSAQFQITFQPPLSFTYPPAITSYTNGQSLNNATAANRLNTDLNSAVSQALKDNSIALLSAPTLSHTGFSGLQATIEESDSCSQAGNFVQQMGTIIYQCVGGVTVTVTSSTPATVAATTSGPDEAGEDDETTAASATTSASSTTNLQKFLVQETMVVTANSTQSLYLSQWQQIAASVQVALENKNMVFLDDITVTI